MDPEVPSSSLEWVPILYISTTWERPSRRDGPRRQSSAPRSSATAVGDIAQGIPLRSNGPLLVFYKARSTAQGLPEPSSLRGSTMGTSPVEHQDSDWV